MKKGTKIHNRLKLIDDETLFSLYNKIPVSCQNCCFNSNCPQIDFMDDTKDCNNYKMAYSLNEIIGMMKEQNVHLQRFCDDYDLKIGFLREMLSAKMLIPWKYYNSMMDRLMEKEEFLECEGRFTENEIENNYASKEGI